LPIGRVIGSEFHFRSPRHRDGQNVDRFARPIGGPRCGNDMKLHCDSGSAGVSFEHHRIAHDQRPAHPPHLCIERRLEADLGADAGGVATGDRYTWELSGGNVHRANDCSRALMGYGVSPPALPTIEPVSIEDAPQGPASRSAKRTVVLRYTTDRFHSRMTSKFAIPSPNCTPACQPLVFRRLAVEASSSGTLRRRSTGP